MVTPELSQYVQEQLAGGSSAADIHDALIASGWPISDADEAVKSVIPSNNPVQSPVLSVEPVNAPKSNGLVIAGVVALLILLIGGGGYAAFVYAKRSLPNAGSAPAASPNATLTFQDTGIQFSYDSTWKKIGASALITGKLDDSALTPSTTPETEHLFFTSANWSAVKKEVADSQALPPGGAIFELVSKIGYQADFSLTRIPNNTAHATALQATQSVCSGTSIDFSTSNQAVASRVLTTTIGAVKGYVILPMSGCDYKTTQVFLDANSTVSTPTPTPYPGVTITSSSNSSSANDSFILSFSNATDLQHLSLAQQIILNSVRLL